MNMMVREKKISRALKGVQELGQGRNKKMWNCVKNAQDGHSNINNRAPKLGHNATYWQAADFNT